MVNGIVLVCNKDFEVGDIVYNSFRNTSWHEKNLHIRDLCNSEETDKVNEFIKELKTEGATFSWEINVAFNNSLKLLKFSGSRFNKNYFIFALETAEDVPILYEELMRINNEQANYIRKILKERFLKAKAPKEDKSTYEDLSRLNNELANLQRELAKKNAELTRLNEIKNHFLGMAAHDLRNPLGNIYNFADLLESKSENFTEKQLRFIQHIKAQSLYMANLVNDLLDFSAIETGKIYLNLQPANLNDLINKTLELSNSLAGKKNIQIDFSPSTSPIELTIDTDKIEQVINNLLTNAIKYSHPDTQIKIQIKDSDEAITIHVTDQGLGIDEDEVSVLFKPFQRTSNQATSGERSTGLGLFICKRIIEAHQGKIHVKSQKGMGSEFYFSLPKINVSYE